MGVYTSSCMKRVKNFSAAASVTGESPINYLHCILYANSQALNFEVALLYPGGHYLKAASCFRCRLRSMRS